MGEHKKIVVLCLFLFTAISSKATFAHDDFIDVIARAKPAVVVIDVTRSKKKFKSEEVIDALGDSAEFFEQELKNMPRKSHGSGFIVQSDEADGSQLFILTAAHVVRGASKIKVSFSNDKRKKAQLVWLDKKKDIALLQVNIDSSNSPSFGLELSDSKVSEGQHVLSISGAFHLSVSSSQGIISAVDVVLPNKRWLKLIQTDAAINPGSSGGPLLNAEGDVIGVISNIYSKTGTFSGAAFAVPSPTVKLLMSKK